MPNVLVFMVHESGMTTREVDNMFEDWASDSPIPINWFIPGGGNWRSAFDYETPHPTTPGRVKTKIIRRDVEVSLFLGEKMRKAIDERATAATNLFFRACDCNVSYPLPPFRSYKSLVREFGEAEGAVKYFSQPLVYKLLSSSYSEPSMEYEPFGYLPELMAQGPVSFARLSTYFKRMLYSPSAFVNKGKWKWGHDYRCDFSDDWDEHFLLGLLNRNVEPLITLMDCNISTDECPACVVEEEE